MGLLIFLISIKTTPHKILSILFGVFIGVFWGILSMLLSIFIVDESQFIHAIKMNGIFEELFVAMMLSFLCGSWLIGGVSFFIFRDSKDRRLG
jgi:hypothetical protein